MSWLGHYTPAPGQPRGYRYWYREGTYWKWKDFWALTDEECDEKASLWLRTTPSGATDVILRGGGPGTKTKVVWEKQDIPLAKSA